MKDLTERLAALSPEQRELLEARMREKGLSVPKPHVITPIPGRAELDTFQTSLDQERLWFIDQMEPGNPSYNIHTTTRLLGPMDVERMQRAVNAVIARHEVLRTTLQVRDGVPAQVVAPRLEIEVGIVDLTHVPEAERDAAASAAAVEAASVRFDLERGPLVQVKLARFTPEDHVMMVCMQHAITDRWSFDVFEREVAQVYVALRDGVEPDLPELPIQFADFAVWQRQQLSGEAGERHLGYWKKTLGDAPMVLEIPTDRPRPPVQTFAGGREYVTYPPEVLEHLKGLAQETGATMFMAMLAALDVLCWTYSGQKDFVIGSAIIDRNRPETEHVIGYFLNMLLLRATIDPRMSFRDLLEQARDTSLGAYAHQEVPFATLVDELKPRQDPSRNPLIQVSYIYLDFPILTTPEELGFRSSSIDVDNGASRFDMTLACWELPEVGIHSYVEYNSDLYDGPKVAQMLRHLGRILEIASADPDRPLQELFLLDEEEHASLCVDFQAPGKTAACRLHDGFLEALVDHADDPALSIGSHTLTYADLNLRSNRVAGRLRALGARPGQTVPVQAERSPELVVALLGVLKSGAAYVPLDPAQPVERRERMLEGLPISAMLVQEGVGELPSTPIRILTIEEAQADGGPDGDLPHTARPEDLAYVMFTSGSTGVPKGVMVPHGAIANRVRWAQEQEPLGPEDRVLHNASFAFDIAAWELFGPLAAGAKVVLPREGEHQDPVALVRLLGEERITVAHFVPSLLRALLGVPEFAGCTSLRLVYCGGETFERDLHDRFREVFPHCTLVHLYGPTEAAISCFAWEAEAEPSPGALPLGRPISGMRAYLLDECLRPVPRGVPGELYLGGVGLARGYAGRADQTADRFVPDPVSGEAGARLYRTGDRAKFRTDGSLEFLGRVDHQVKIRGYRIEPGEVEAVLEGLPGIAHAVATASGDEADRKLVAYLVAESGSSPPSDAELRSAVRRSLPEYMLPSLFCTLDELPLNANGKLDRAALPDPAAGQGSTVEHVAPRTETEETVAAIWQQVLKREGVGALDDFFDLGGNSLLATQVVAQLRTAFGIELPLRRFFEGSSVETLAEIVEEELVARLEAMSDEEAAAQLEALQDRPRSG